MDSSKETNQATEPQQSVPDQASENKAKFEAKEPKVGIDNKNKKIEELKFYPDNPTDFTHKARFSAYEKTSLF